MIVPNKYCPMGVQNALTCKGELCMWFDAETMSCRPFHKDVPREVTPVEEKPVEEKPKSARTRKKDAASAQ